MARAPPRAVRGNVIRPVRFDSGLPGERRAHTPSCHYNEGYEEPHPRQFSNTPQSQVVGLQLRLT